MSNVAISFFIGLMLFVSPIFGAEFVPGEVLVKMKGRPSGAKSAAFLGKVSNKAFLKATYGKLGMHHLGLKPGQDVLAAVSELRADPDVEYAEPNFIVRKAIADDIRADENKRFSSGEAAALSIQFSSSTFIQNNADVKVTQAWSQMSPSVSEIPVVAVIDTGVDYLHEVFVESSAIWSNPGETGINEFGQNRATNGIDDDGNGFIDDHRGWNFHGRNNNPMDDDDHGTHVAGIVLGVTQNIFASTLAQATIKIMPLKFLGGDGSGSTADAITAIYYAVNNGANVINNSWGGGSYSASLHDALTYAYNAGVTIVSAAGNSASNNDQSPMYPAGYPIPSQLAVAATNDFDSLASFSNFGANSVDVAAPGVGIYSTTAGSTYRFMSGTSMAAPFVAGLAAATLREAPQLSGYQVKNILINSSALVSALAGRVKSGSRVNSLDAVVSAKGSSSVSPVQPQYTPVAPSSAERAPASEPKGGCGMVSTAVMQQSFQRFSSGGGPTPPAALLIVLALAPLLVWQVIRIREMNKGINRRQFDRFAMNSEIKVKVGDRELVGQMNTISLGGASFKADALLERGGIVTLQIASPDGGSQVEVQGKIVWSESQKSYGVQFADTKQSVLSNIRDWTKGMAKVGT